MFLFCATDAGGARQLDPVIRAALAQGKSCMVLASAVTKSIFAETGIASEEKALHSLDEATAFLREQQPDAVILGTTGTIKTERYLIAGARMLKIPSVVVLDEWYNYKLRFQDEHEKLDTYLPDVICVQDELSVKLAIQEGLPKEILKITSNPSLAELVTRGQTYRKDPPTRPEIFAKHADRPSVLYLSQPLRRAYGAQPGDKGMSGTFIGFQEDIVREDLADMFSTIGTKVLVVEKFHPSEGEKSPPKHKNNVIWTPEESTTTPWAYLWHADIIIGMNTAALLQGAILGRHPLSYQPNAFDPNLCTAVRLGLAELQTEKKTMLKRLKELLPQEREEPKPLTDLVFAKADAAERVLEVVEELIG